MRKAIASVFAMSLLLWGARSSEGAIQNNAGLIDVPPDFIAVADFCNTGTVNINAGGTFFTAGQFINEGGTVNISPGGTLLLGAPGLEIIGGDVNTPASGLSSPTFATIGGGTIPMDMNIIVRDVRPFPQFPQFSLPGTLTLQGDQVTTNDGSVELDGAMASFVGFENVATNNGTIRLRNGNVFNQNGFGLFLQNGLIEVQSGSTFNVSPGATYFQLFNPAAHLFVDATSTLNAASGLNFSAGTARIDGVVNGNVDSNSGVVINGDGKIVGRFNNFGLFQIGNSPGDFEVDGLFQQMGTGVTEFEINGLLNSQFDRLLTMSATLGGTLKLIFDPGLILADGQQWELIDVDVLLTGEFDSVEIMGLSLSSPTPGVLGSGPKVFIGAVDNTLDLFLNYDGGDGNDVVLTVELQDQIPEPASLALLAIGAAAIQSGRGRRKG